jgi:hypothetical protein
MTKMRSGFRETTASTVFFPVSGGERPLARWAKERKSKSAANVIRPDKKELDSERIKSENSRNGKARAIANW